MLEAAALYISIAVGKKLLDHAGDDAGDAFDVALRKLGRWVREKVMVRPTGKAAIDVIAGAPAGEAGIAVRDGGRTILAASLAEVIADPASAAELEKLVTELKTLTPKGLTFDTRLVLGEVTDSKVVGTEISRPLEDGSKVKTVVEAKT